MLQIHYCYQHVNRFGRLEENSPKYKLFTDIETIVLLAFVVCGSVVFELGALFPKVWEWIAGTFSALFGSK